MLFGVAICACRYVSANDKEGFSVQSEAEKLICRAEDTYAEIAEGKGRLDILKGIRSLPSLRPPTSNSSTTSHVASKPASPGVAATGSAPACGSIASSTLTRDMQDISFKGEKH